MGGREFTPDFSHVGTDCFLSLHLPNYASACWPTKSVEFIAFKLLRVLAHDAELAPPACCFAWQSDQHKLLLCAVWGAGRSAIELPRKLSDGSHEVEI